MGNCQAVDTSTLMIQHPSGRVERWYWPVMASEVMKTNPGHYVALIITLYVPEQKELKEKELEINRRVRITRVKILRPNDTLVLGQAYRLISSQEVMKGIWAKKYAKMKKKELELASEKPNEVQVCEKQSLRCDQREERTLSESEMNNQVVKQERHRQRLSNSASSRSRSWRPSLQSISEAGS
ncbi:Protein of unknown function DUF4228 [Macleaya cordata]|uniref:Uncharacterized protein n=1 Tax=Macleaya cordata TaxID=56857 RepID=A0A200R0M4_MACCD|nr:Protein of unknown function DUF4228 [Macleaya cordata]